MNNHEDYCKTHDGGECSCCVTCEYWENYQNCPDCPRAKRDIELAWLMRNIPGGSLTKDPFSGLWRAAMFIGPAVTLWWAYAQGDWVDTPEKAIESAKAAAQIE